jgi:hypothetical protein
VKAPGYADIAFPCLNGGDNARSLLRGQSARDFRQTSSTANQTNGFFAGVKFSGDINLAHSSLECSENASFSLGGKFVTALHFQFTYWRASRARIAAWIPVAR